LENRRASDIFDLLFRHNSSIATLLESPFPTPKDQPQLCRYSICAGAPRVINNKVQLWTPKLGEIIPFLSGLLKSLKPENNQPLELPFIGGWLGWLGYDLAWEVEKLPYLKEDRLPFPVAYWYEPESFALLDHQKQIIWLASSQESNLDGLESRIRANKNCLRQEKISQELSRINFVTDKDCYKNTVTKAKEYIKAGDIFQANLSLRFTTNTTLNSWDIYQNLQKINPSPFASYWQTPWGVVISCSPERLVQLQGKKATTRPIAGTRSRGASFKLDQELEQELINNTKERAEHIMLVDLERNDLGRVCEWGSVNVDELFTIERYSHVMHLVSNISGQLKPEMNAIDLIQSLFPGGTITGCPKVRCMEIIEELEPVRRSLFYGSCGYLDPRGNLDLNILIRTLLYQKTMPSATIYGQVGAGIVADSDPEREWDESLYKAQAQIAALQTNSWGA
jgi:para-aminobenzoate synthetase component 1